MSLQATPPRTSASPSLSATLDENPYYEGEKVPVILELDSTAIAKLDVEYQSVVETIASLAQDKLCEWESFEVSFPETKFDHSAPIIKMDDLFQAPNSHELEKLVLDEEGNFASLTNEQWEQIRRTGTFEIASQDFEGQKHIWKVSRILQKGEEPIQRTYEKHLGTVFDQVAVQVPERLSLDGSISVGKGVQRIYHALRAIPAFAIGIPEVKEKYSWWTINDHLENEKLALTRQVLIDWHDGDTRLYDKDTSKRLSETLGELERKWASYRDANYNIWAQSLINEQDDRGSSSSPSQMIQVVDKEYCTFVENYAPLEELEPGYGTLLANARRVEHIGKTLTEDFNELSRQEKKRIKAKLTEQHRIKSKSEGWFRKNVDSQMNKFLKNEIWVRLEEKASELGKAGLELEANTYRALAQFKKDREPALRKALESEKVASRAFKVKTRIWRSKNWERETVQLQNGKILYAAEKHRTTEVETDQLFWRIRLAGARGFAAVKNGLHSVLVSNLWNGPLGLKSLFAKDAFYAEKTIDDRGGQIIDDKNSKTHTLRSRVHGLWDGVAQSRQEFEDRPDAGILPKNLSRIPHQIYHNGIRGVGGTLFLVTGQPLVTAVNVAASSVAAVTAPIWASIIPVSQYALAPLVLDVNSPQESDNGKVRIWFPIIGHSISDFAVGGVGQTALAASSAAVFHPAAALATGVYAGLRKYSRKAYDFTLAHAVLKKGRQPATDTWLNKRIHGPGLSENYFFQVRPEIALMALQAELEKRELQLFRGEVVHAITDPVRNYQKFFQELLGSIGTMNVSGSITGERLKDVEKARLKEFNQAYREHEKALSAISHIQVDEQRIRQSSADLADTLLLATALVESFYEEKVQPLLNESQTLAFWNQESLKVRDFEALAKHYLARIFSPEFLVPLEVQDEDFIIDVSDPDVRQFVQSILDPDQ